MQLLPDARIGPVGDVVVGAALEIQPAEHRRAHGEQREAALMMHIDQLVRHRRRLREDADPGERVFAVVERQRALRNRRPAHPMKAVASGDEIAGKLRLFAVLAKADARARLQIGKAHRFGLEQDLSPGVEVRVDEVLHHFVLAVDRHHLAGQVGQGDAMALAGKAQRQPVVDQPLAVQAVGEAELGHEIDRALFEQAGADALDHVLPAAIFQDDGVDAVTPQQMGEQQACRSRADDSHLCAHQELIAPAAPRPSAWPAASSSTAGAKACR